jgi:hypothetical protein
VIVKPQRAGSTGITEGISASTRKRQLRGVFAAHEHAPGTDHPGHLMLIDVANGPRQREALNEAIHCFVQRFHSIPTTVFLAGEATGVSRLPLP